MARPIVRHLQLRHLGRPLEKTRVTSISPLRQHPTNRPGRIETAPRTRRGDPVQTFVLRTISSRSRRSGYSTGQAGGSVQGRGGGVEV